MTWYIYILKCADSSFYTGITNDLPARLEAHNTSKGAKYTRGRLPITLVYTEICHTRSEALKRELEIKRLSRGQKKNLIAK